MSQPRSHGVDGLLPDHDLQAEDSVISAALTDAPESLPLLRRLLAPEQFFFTANRLVFQACCDLADAGQVVDLVTVGSRLRETGRIVDVGGVPYLNHVIDAAPSCSPESLQAYARVVRQAAQVRALDDAARAVAARCRGPIADRPGLLAESRAAIEAATELASAETPGAPVGAIVAQVLTRAASPELADACTLTGFSAFDRATTGLRPGDLWVLAARPGFGKTALAGNVSLNVAFAGQGVLFFSLEMPKEQIGERLACGEARVDMGRLRSRALDAEDWSRFGHAQNRLANLPLWVDDSKNLPVAELQARALERKQHWARTGVPLGLVVVDYLQLVKTTARKDRNREQEVAEVSKGLKAMAGVLGCPVLALAQLSRSSEQQGRRPRPSDLRESGQVEQDADGILFLHRDKDTQRGCLDVVIAKQRQGLVTTLSLAWWPRYMRFLDPHLASAPQEGLVS